MHAHAKLQMPSTPALSAEQKAKLNAYASLLLKWNQKINLIGKTTENEIRARHIEDSLQLLDYLPENTKTLTDFGSGAGLPGLVLAIARPDIQVHLIESDYRKCAFLKEAARITETPVNVHNQRIEKMEGIKSDVITARAFAPVGEILDLSAPFAHEGTEWVLLKGKTAEAEVKKAEGLFAFEYTLSPSCVAPRDVKEKGFVLTINHVRKR